MKYIKQYMAALVSSALAMVVPVTSHAFTSQAVVTNTASATVSGGAAAMSVALLNVSNNATATSIGWTVNAGSGWQEASQYIQINSTLTLAGSGIQTYTNNTQYTGVISSNTASPAGLIDVANPAAAPVPTAWQIVALGKSPVAPDDPNNAALAGHTGYAWFYHEDKRQVANNQGVTGPFVNAAPYIEMEIAGGPPQIQFAQGSFGNSTSNINNVYLEGNFQNALGGSTYQTTSLTVELFTP
jgi:hypothetical protein